MRSLITAIGLEVHVELKTQSKIFCRCPITVAKAIANQASCPVCQGQPGALPALNPDVVRLAIQCSLALQCEVQPRSTFERKHYVYPDIPKNYQITQNDEPIGLRGQLAFKGAGDKERIVRIRRVHMEEDAAKLEHRPIERRNVSLVDFNRCGVPLPRIVSEADMVEPDDAEFYLDKLRHIIRWHGISEAEMHKGQMRCDANLSVRPEDSSLEDSVKWEVKNLNSLDAVVAALKRARELQRDVLLRSSAPPKSVLKQSTFHWDNHKRQIKPRRDKETSDDYFYIAEPDLMEVCLTSANQDAASEAIRIGPDEAMRQIAELEVPAELVHAITRDRTVYEYWQAAQNLYPAGATDLASLIVSNVRPCAGDSSGAFENFIRTFTADRLAELAKRLQAGEIIRNSDLTKLIKDLHEHPDSNLMGVAREKGLAVVAIGEDDQERQLKALIEAWPAQVDDFHTGKKEVIGFFVGQARQRLPGVRPADLHKALMRLLSEH